MFDIAEIWAHASFEAKIIIVTMIIMGLASIFVAIERTIDTVARTLALDPLELRRKNFVRPSAMPYRNPLGARYDSGDYERAMDLAVERIDWHGFED